MKNRLAEVVATGFGSGFAPVAPATFGSAAALLVYWALPFRGAGDSLAFFFMIAAVSLAGLWASNAIISDSDRDPKRCVIDEWAGVWVTCLFLPATWHWLLAAFFLFRFLDIAKPAGIRRLEALPGGLGIMADDIAAGVLGAVILNAIRLALPG